jgi:hypothetical protein
LLKQFLISILIFCALSTGISNAVNVHDKEGVSAQITDSTGVYLSSVDSLDIDLDAETVSVMSLLSKAIQSQIHLTATAIFKHAITQTHIRAPPFIS